MKNNRQKTIEEIDFPYFQGLMSNSWCEDIEN